MEYFVSPDGEIFSNGHKLKHCIHKNGYHSVELWKNGKRKREYVHRLVAKEYIPNPKGLKEVNHLNGNKSDNSVNNLEWCSSSDNKIHAYRTGIRQKHTKLSLEQVKYIKNHPNENRKKLAAQFNVSYWCICNVIQNKAFKEIT